MHLKQLALNTLTQYDLDVVSEKVSMLPDLSLSNKSYF